MTTGNPQANSIIEIFHQLLANLINTFGMDKKYVHEDDPRKGIPVVSALDIRSTFHTTNKN